MGDVELKLQLVRILDDGREVEVDEECWDDWVEPSTSVEYLCKTLFTHRNKFHFPSDQSIRLHTDNISLDSALDGSMLLADSAVPKQPIGDIEIAKLYLRGWPPQWELEFLLDFRDAFLKGRTEVPLTDGWSRTAELPTACTGIGIVGAHLRRLVLNRAAIGNPDVRIAGELPPTLGLCVKLRTLDLSENELRGCIPPEICGCAALENLYLQRNALSGPLPLALGQLKQLRNLVLFENELEGPLPASIGECVQLLTVWLQQNRLCGPLPDSIGDCAALKVVNVGQNRLSGTVTSGFGAMRNLQQLTLAGNGFEGVMPASLQYCKKLVKLDCRDNRLEATEATMKLLSEEIGARLRMQFDEPPLSDSEEETLTREQSETETEDDSAGAGFGFGAEEEKR